MECKRERSMNTTLCVWLDVLSNEARRCHRLKHPRHAPLCFGRAVDEAGIPCYRMIPELRHSYPRQIKSCRLRIAPTVPQTTALRLAWAMGICTRTNLTAELSPPLQRCTHRGVHSVAMFSSQESAVRPDVEVQSMCTPQSALSVSGSTVGSWKSSGE